MTKTMLAAATALLVAASAAPSGRWSGTTDMNHGKLPLLFEVEGGPEAYRVRAILGSTNLDDHGVAVDSLRVTGDSVRFSFEVRSQMGTARVGIAGVVGATTAEGTITMANQGIVIDRGTWTAERVDAGGR